MTSHNDLDHVIDDVAREMTAGSVDPNLRTRVLADIERPRPFAWRPVFATACAAGAVAALLFVASRGTLRNSPGALVNQTSTLREPPSTSGSSPGALREPPGSSGNPRVASRARVPADRRPANAVFMEPSLEEEPISVPPIAVTPITPTELIGAEQLPSIAPITVAPLDTGEEK